MGGGVSYGVGELGFGSVWGFGVVAEAGGFGGGRVGKYEGVGVCMNVHWDRDVVGTWWEG